MEKLIAVLSNSAGQLGEYNLSEIEKESDGSVYLEDLVANSRDFACLSIYNGDILTFRIEEQ